MNSFFIYLGLTVFGILFVVALVAGVKIIKDCWQEKE